MPIGTFTGMLGTQLSQPGSIVLADRPITGGLTGLTGLLGDRRSLLGQIVLSLPNPPPRVVDGPGYGGRTYGVAPYASRGFSSSGPVLAFIQPTDNQSSVPLTLPIVIQLTDVDELDLWSLGVKLDGIDMIAGGDFVVPYGGTVLFDGQTCLISIGTHPSFSRGAHTLATSVTNLDGTSATFNTTFTTATFYVANVSDSITVTDQTQAAYKAVVGSSDSITVSDSTTASQHFLANPAESVSVGDSLAVSRQVELNLVDFVTVSSALAVMQVGHISIADSVTVLDSLNAGEQDEVRLPEALSISEVLDVQYSANQLSTIAVTIVESFSSGSAGISANNTQLTVSFAVGVRVDGTRTLPNFSMMPLNGATFPVQLLGATPIVQSLASGSDAIITATTQPFGNTTVPVYTVQIPSVNFLTLNAAYLSVTSPTNTEQYLRIITVVNSTTVQVDRPLITDPLNGAVLWEATTAVQGIVFPTTKFTNGGSYFFSSTGLQSIPGVPFEFSGDFTATAPQPQVTQATALDDGQIVVSFTDNMLVDRDLLDPREYRISGPGSPYIERVSTISPTEVLLLPRNLQGGSYTLTVGTHTPHDVAGNPIDPLFNTVIFSSSQPIESRSVFTDYGPIARPPLVLETGTGVVFDGPQTLTLTGASIPSTYAGFVLELSGTALNDGTYRVLAVKTQNTVKVVASFNLPDAGALGATWSIVNHRDGEIADDPAHVTVTINGNPVVPEEVIGLLGQIVLPSVPVHGSDVQVGYSWVCNPTVEVRRLNSREFRLNEWNRDVGALDGAHHYRFNNVLPVTTNFTTPPSVQQGTTAGIVSTSQVSLPDGNILVSYAGLTLVLTAGLNAGAYDIVSVPDAHHVNVSGTLNPADPLSGHIPWTIGDTSDIQATLPQPLLRDLKYRAYERAYTALLNDPNTLTLNAPTNLIAYPPLARIVAQTFVSYESAVLPEADPVAPWTRVGTGSASIVSLQLVVTSPTSGTFPGGTPIYWLQDVDQTFPHVFAATWDMQVNASPVTQGVFTGVAFGYSDDNRVAVFGYLNDSGVSKVGFLVKGAGNDPSLITAWTGGLDGSGNPTNAPLTFDWTVLHSFRIYQDPSGTINLYLDGAVIPSLRVTQDQLPYLEELAAPFDSLQGVFFGSLSAQAQNTSTWDFVRYLVLPLNPLQTAPSIFVDYVANVIPEESAKPWTPVGYHGTETILGGAYLLLDSTSAVPDAEEILTGLVGGDFRGYFRLEPLIATSAEVVVDFNVQLRTWTQGFSPNALMVAIDDSDRLIQLCFVTDQPAPKFSYGGNGFPTDQTPPWSALGGQTAAMFGRTLQIVDVVPLDGLVYVIDDTNPVSPYQHHYAQMEALSGNSSMVAVATVQHRASESIVAGSFFYPPDLDTLRPAVASISAQASVSAQATVRRGVAAAIHGSARVQSQPIASPHQRILSPDNAYILEARLEPISFTVDPFGFIGAMAQVYDSQRTVGFMLQSITGSPFVALQGDGTEVASFSFNWNDGQPHTYRVVYTPAIPTGVVTLFVDGVMVGTPQNYDNFPVPTPSSTTGFVAFGSSLPGTQSVSTVDWFYCNAWRVENGQKFIGVWRGTNTGTLLDYWTPTKVGGSNSLVLGNAIMDTAVNFLTAGVQATDYLIVDAGPNQGVYAITSVAANTLSIDISWPVAPSRVNYRIAKQIDWTQQHDYRMVKAPSGDDVAIFVDGDPIPVIFLTYDNTILPPSQVGLPRVISGTLPSVSWGAFDPTNLSQSSWQYLRYGVTRSPTELRIIPPHQVLNQRNLIQSYERHLTNIPHTLTDFWSESEGITPNTYPDLLDDPNLVAFTLLNEGTPLVPQTQTYEVQSPQPVIEFVGGLNNIANVLNSSAFILNDATRRVGIIVPDDVLYSSLQIFERDTGQTSLIAPFDDECQPKYGPIYYQKEVCLTYDAQTLPENDPTAITPWSFYAQNSNHAFRSVFGGVLTYGTDSVGTQTLYRNATPLPDAPSLGTQVTFRLKVLQDSSGGLGDSQIRFGFSAIGLTASLALVSEPNGQRYVLVIDQLSNMVLAGIPFDFLDGNSHMYRLVRNPGAGKLEIFVDS